MEELTELSLLLVVHLLYEAFLSLDEREIITPNISNAVIASVVNADLYLGSTHILSKST